MIEVRIAASDAAQLDAAATAVRGGLDGVTVSRPHRNRREDTARVLPVIMRK